jgi:hypothetical protein
MSATAVAKLGLVEPNFEMNKPPRTPGASHSQALEISMQEDIAKLAYALWQQRGCPQGSAIEDWLEAERSLLQSSEHVSR